MVAKNAKRPRPNKNSNGQDKKPQPSSTRTLTSSPGKPPEAPPPPGAPLEGHTNPLTHPQHPAMSASPAVAGAPGGEPAKQIQERIQFKDMPPAAQNQSLQQMGLDPYAMANMAQQQVSSAQPTSGPIPSSLSGPGIPQELGVESFPDDMAHLTTLMQQGYAPGASAQEHAYGQNAHSMARAQLAHAFSQAQEGAGQPTQQPVAPPVLGMGPPGTAPAPPGPPMQSALGAPPQDPNAPGGIPPELIAALMQQDKKKRSGAVR